MYKLSAEVRREPMVTTKTREKNRPLKDMELDSAARAITRRKESVEKKVDDTQEVFFG